MSQSASSPNASSRCTSTITNAAVGDALSQSSYASLGSVDHEVDGDQVVLRGVVTSYHLKQMAQTVVQRVAGVRRIDNRLSVARPATAYL